VSVQSHVAMEGIAPAYGRCTGWCDAPKMSVGGFMELSQLRAFVAIAKIGQLTRAAEKLHLSQPALSGQIKALEETLGISLFERSSSGMALTAGGRTLLGDPAAKTGGAASARSAGRPPQPRHGSRSRDATAGRFPEPRDRKPPVDRYRAAPGVLGPQPVRYLLSLFAAPGYFAGTITSRSLPDSAPQASPARPSICRTSAPRRSEANVSNFSVAGSNLTIALIDQSVSQTLS